MGSLHLTQKESPWRKIRKVTGTGNSSCTYALSPPLIYHLFQISLTLSTSPGLNCFPDDLRWGIWALGHRAPFRVVLLHLSIPHQHGASGSPGVLTLSTWRPNKSLPYSKPYILPIMRLHYTCHRIIINFIINKIILDIIFRESYCFISNSEHKDNNVIIGGMWLLIRKVSVQM